MNYELIKALINELEAIDKALEIPKEQREQDITVQDWYDTKNKLNNELGFAQIDNTNGHSLYWYISPDEIEAEPEGLSYIMERTEIDLQDLVSKEPEFGISVSHIDNTVKDAFNRVCRDIEDEQRFICEQCEHEFWKDEIHELGMSKFCGDCYQQLTGGRG